MNSKTILIQTIILALSSLSLAGCSGVEDPFSDQRRGVSGYVQVDGTPLPAGTIQFIPIDGTSGPRAGSTITNGIFSIDPKIGPVAGSYRVEIQAVDPAEPHPDDIEAVKRYIAAREKSGGFRALPARYNRNSELRQEISVDQQNDFQFSLTSK